MKNLILILICAVLLGGAVGCKQNDTAEFLVETMAMGIGYELRDSFEWTSDVDRYYVAIMDGKLTIDAAQAAESYLRTVTHPLIANRMTRLAGMLGFNLDDLGHIVGIGNVDIKMLQAAAFGFKMGLNLTTPPDQALLNQKSALNRSTRYDFSAEAAMTNIELGLNRYNN